MDNIKIIKNDKFKDVYISLRFLSNNLEDATKRSLLSLMISDRSQKYNTKELVIKKLDNLYGASFSSNVFRYGSKHLIELSMSVLNKKFVFEDLLVDQVDFLANFLYKPNFSEESLKEAKIILKDMILRQSDNLTSQSIIESLKIAAKGYPASTLRFGNIEEIDKVTLDDIKDIYHNTLKFDQFDIIVIGDVNKDYCSKLIKEYFTFNDNKIEKVNYLVKSSEVISKVDKKDTNQGYFSIVYDVNVYNEKKDFWLAQLTNMIIGGFSNSLLFENVREKNSLAYSINSLYQGYDGLIMLIAGVNLAKIDKAIDLSLKQVEKVKNQEFSINLFNSAKEKLIDVYTKGLDSNTSLVDLYYRNKLLNQDFKIEDIKDILEKISIEEVVLFSKNLKLNTIYKIVGEGYANN